MPFTEGDFKFKDIWQLYDASLNGTMYTQDQFNSNDNWMLYTALIGGGGGGGVQSVTGDNVDNTDADNPIVNNPQADNITIQGQGTLALPFEVTPGLFAEIIDPIFLTGLTSSQLITTFIAPADGTYTIDGLVNINAVSGPGNIQITIDYTDENGNAVVGKIIPLNTFGGTIVGTYGVVGNLSFVSTTIRCTGGTAVTINGVVGSGGGATINYDVGVVPSQLS